MTDSAYRTEKTAPINRCIYCGSKGGSKNPLTDEHVLPFGMDGWAVLAKASCKSCAALTSAVERYALRDVFFEVRTAMGMRSRRKKQRPATMPLTIRRNSVESTIDLPAADHPGPLVLPVFDTPSLPKGEKQDGYVKLVSPYTWKFSDWNRVSSLGDVDIISEWRFDPLKFCLFLAKIAHCSTIFIRGYEKFSPLLDKFILNKSSEIFDYVGCASDRRYKKKGEPSSDIEVLWGFEDGYIRTYIWFFPNTGSPCYEVISGREKHAYNVML